MQKIHLNLTGTFSGEKEVKGIVIDKKNKTVTVASESFAASLALKFTKALKNRVTTVKQYNELEEKEKEIQKDVKLVTKSTCSKSDEFDLRVGVALALVYNMFGSKTKFNKFVEELEETADKKTKAVDEKETEDKKENE